MSWIYVAVGIVCLLVMQSIRSLLSFEIPRYLAREASKPSDLDFGALDLVDQRDSELRELGFGSPIWIACGQSLDGESWITNHAVCIHRSNGVFVWLGPVHEFAQPNQLLTYYVTKLADGRYAVTQVSDPYFEAIGDPLTPAQTIAPSSAADELEQHEAFVRALGSEAIEPHTTDLVGFAEGHMNAIRERLLQRGMLRVSDGVTRPSWSFAYRLMTKLRSRPKLIPHNGEPLPAGRLAYMSSFHRRLQLRAPSQRDQWLLLVLSVLLSMVIGWPLFGLELTSIILVVITFHEFGHWVAMKMSGYRNPQITLLPLLGGVTIGYEKDASATRRAWVALAGPLPGIVLGWALLVLSTTTFDWESDRYNFAIGILLFINYLNVLPIPPLDGSHVLRAILPPRWVVIQTLVVLLGVAVGAYVAWALEFWPLALIAGLHLLGLKSMWATTRETRHFAGSSLSRVTDSRERLASLFAALEQRLGPAKQVGKRVALANGIDSQLTTTPMGGAQRVLVSSVYAILLAVPVLALLVYADDLGRRAQEEERDSLYERFEQDYEAFEREAAAMDLPSLIEALDGLDRPLRGNDARQMADAEERLGRSLPEHLKAFYKIADGADFDVSIGRLTDVRKIDPALFLTGDLSVFTRDGVIEFFDADYNAINVPIAATQNWWVLGHDDQLFSYLFADPAAAGQSPGIFQVGEEGSFYYPSMRDFVEMQWVGRQNLVNYESVWEDRRAAAMRELEGLTAVEMLDRLPKEPLLQRLIAREFLGSRPAGRDAVLAAEMRIGHELPPDYRELLTVHNGSAHLNLLPIGAVVAATFGSDEDNRIAVQLAQDVTTSSFDRDDLARCWIIAGRMSEETHSEPDEGISAEIYWCPEQTVERRYIHLGRFAIEQSFTDIVRSYSAGVLML